jgi:hypothetical protein
MWRLKVLGTSLVGLFGMVGAVAVGAVVAVRKLLELRRMRRCPRHRRAIGRPEPSQDGPRLIEQ